MWLLLLGWWQTVWKCAYIWCPYRFLVLSSITVNKYFFMNSVRVHVLRYITIHESNPQVSFPSSGNNLFILKCVGKSQSYSAKISKFRWSQKNKEKRYRVSCATGLWLRMPRWTQPFPKETKQMTTKWQR